MKLTPEKQAEKQGSVAIRDLFPDLSEDQFKEVEKTFHGYLETVWDIYEELKRERPQIFDRLQQRS